MVWEALYTVRPSCSVLYSVTYLCKLNPPQAVCTVTRPVRARRITEQIIRLPWLPLLPVYRAYNLTTSTFHPFRSVLITEAACSSEIFMSSHSITQYDNSTDYNPQYFALQALLEKHFVWNYTGRSIRRRLRISNYKSRLNFPMKTEVDECVP
jgi:hypothetical protein